MSGTPEMDDFDIHTMPPPVKTETPHGVRVRRDSSVRRGTRQPSVGPRSGTPTPTMSGFYFHQNSEPYVWRYLRIKLSLLTLFPQLPAVIFESRS